MATATITAKGQITIPKAVRAALGLNQGDRVVFLLEDGRAFLQPVRGTGIAGLRGVFRGRAPFKGREAERASARSAVVEHVVRSGDA